MRRPLHSFCLVNSRFGSRNTESGKNVTCTPPSFPTFRITRPPVMYPLRFEPIFQRYLWGGRRLAEVLNKPIGDDTCAESWEIVDHNQHQSVVKFGELAGKSLHDLSKTLAHPSWAIASGNKSPIPVCHLNCKNDFRCC